MGVRVLVIGLDGVPWDLVSRWVEQGIMPNLARLIREGTAGPLDSTMPPTSGPSWTTFSTGRNPGNTGIYDFLYRRADDYVFPPVNTTMRSGKTLWRMLSERGDRVCVVNLPVSYPVEEVNGVMVSGWMTPYFARDYTWPRELADELDEVVGNYRIYPSETWSAGRSKAFFRASDELLEMLTRSNLHLMEREDWDLFMGVYFDTDRILHQVYHFLDDGHPWREGSEGDWSEPVLRYFSRLDADIGRLVDKAGEKARVLVMSDHGMGRASRFVVLNNLLLKLGFIQLSDDIATRFKAFVFRRGFTLRNVHKLVDRLGLARHAEYKNVYSFDGLLKRFFLSFLNVDWSRSRAYSFGRHYGSLFVNLKGREPQGCVEPGAEYEKLRDELEHALLAYVDPELGRPLVKRCLRREDVYHGERFEEAPDLLLLPEDPADIFFGLSDFGSSRVWDRTYRYSGMHREQGLLVAHGPGVERGQAFAGGGVVDLAPTLMHMLGRQLPGDLDGRVLESLFTPDWLAANPPNLGGGSSAQSPDGAKPFNEDEEEEIMDRLRDLGYMN